MSKEVVDEIMLLVQGYAEGIRQGTISEAQGDGFNQGCADFSKKKFDLIESKLRELVENSFSVREPLSRDDADQLWGACLKKYKRPGPYELIVEFCNIANTSGEE